MSEEREIEKQLRAYAEQRRKDAGEGMELHPATRRLLQGERERVLGKHATGGAAAKAGLFSGFWPRLAWGVSMLTMLGIGTWVLVHSERTKSTREPAVELAAAPATPLAKPVAATPVKDAKKLEIVQAQPAAAPVLARADGPAPGALAESRTIMPELKSPPAEVVAPATMPPATLKRDADIALKTKVHAPDQAVATSGAGAVVAAKKAELSGAVDALVATPEPAAEPVVTESVPVAQFARSSRNFYNYAPENDRSADAERTKALGDKQAGNAMLGNFQLEQDGKQVRIVDQDGSVYNGVLLVDARDEEAGRRQAAANLPAARPLRRQMYKEVPASPAAGNEAQSFRFAVAGTNLSLRQRVTINGKFVADTNLVAIGQDTFSNQQLKTGVQSGLPLSNGRVIGRAVTADGQQLELNATEVLMK